jgi:hypothetical protein
MISSIPVIPSEFIFHSPIGINDIEDSLSNPGPKIEVATVKLCQEAIRFQVKTQFYSSGAYVSVISILFKFCKLQVE